MGGKKVLGIWVACAVHSHALAAAYSLTAMSSQRFFSYFFALEDEAKSRYLEKLAIIGPDVDDPYVIDSAATSDAWPSIEFPDVYNYIINTPSLYTKESLKAYKSQSSNEIEIFCASEYSSDEDAGEVRQDGHGRYE